MSQHQFEISLSNSTFDFESVSDVFGRQLHKSTDEQIADFEFLVSQLTHSNCLAVNSGTSALHLALLALDIGPGDYVICSSFTFVASANPIMYQGAIPVFIDCETESWNMDPDLLKSALETLFSENVKPKAIIVPHIYGMPGKIKELVKLSSDYNIPIIEDAAQSFGATVDHQSVGTFGKMGIFSFNSNKIFSLNGGGILLSEDPEIIQKTKYYARQAKGNYPYYFHEKIGYNYVMSPLNASLGYCLWSSWPNQLKRRHQIFNRYYSNLESVPGIKFQKEPSQNHLSNKWLTAIIFNGKKLNLIPELLKLQLSKVGADSRRLWKPLCTQPAFSGCRAFRNGNSMKMFETGLCLPSNSSITDYQIDKVCEVVKSVVDISIKN